MCVNSHISSAFFAQGRVKRKSIQLAWCDSITEVISEMDGEITRWEKFQRAIPSLAKQTDIDLTLAPRILNRDVPLLEEAKGVAA